MLSTIVRFQNGHLNITGTVEETVKRRFSTGQFGVEHIVMDLEKQGLTVTDKSSTKTCDDKNTIGRNQIRNRLNTFTKYVWQLTKENNVYFWKNL